MRTRIQHVREEGTRQPLATLVAVNHEGVTKIGWSKRHPALEDGPFHKKRGVAIALERAKKGIAIKFSDDGRFLLTAKGYMLPHVLIEALPKFVTRVEEYFHTPVVNFTGE